MSVTAARGFLASGVSAGIKDSGDPDLALVVNRGPSRAAAGVFTSNRVQINGVWVCRDGAAGEPRDKVDLSGRQVRLTVELRSGEASAVIRTNDLTAAYVHENSAYSS
ncbi:bifunctional ornithine acetyltransferase/N-acetylglutamate synthase [Streptomyces sp. TRM70350]|uniref:bifunctional ornithine acetyltransferase/N-acetylglutamate synthase n=1 Tax=Streptomyces sp. TRM70350 TaxID=2856165 RepID=UPI0035A8CA9C